MGRTKGPDVEKVKSIRKVLKVNPKGLWIREISRKTGLDKSTVSRYLAGYMRGEIEDAYPKVKGDLIRIVKLRGR